MTYLFSDRKKIERLFRNKFVYLFLDYDGTLTPISETPDRAATPKGTKSILNRLSKEPNIKVAVVSGRSLNDIRKKVGLAGNMIYVGNHGFEIKGPKINFKSPVPVRYRKDLEEIKKKLKRSLSGIKGAIIEDKWFSISLHYRLAAKKDIQRIKTEFYAATIVYEVRNSITVRTGKKMLEIRPPVEWDKGKVVLWLLARRRFVLKNKKINLLPVYIGDDVTDEDAFGALKNRGLTVRVGKLKSSKALYYLKNTGEVTEFLKEILKEKNDRKSERAIPV